ncbi:MAG: hypothetical protein OXR66_00325 [Candidatus Woesearchaeota archaeon]|nr:hypothetical protein [Candidatus Woesearchaeota archaeon]
MSSVRKSISITDAQEAFLQENNISLSKMVQKTINQTIDDMKFAHITEQRIQEMEGKKNNARKKSENNCKKSLLLQP